MSHSAKPLLSNERLPPILGKRVAPWIIPSLLAVGITLRCILLSDKHPLWLDELLSWYPLSVSFSAMLHATTDAINSAPPLYFVVTWVWAAVFGHSALALRLFSAISIATASLLLFYVLRRAYGSLAATLALLVALSNKELLLYSVEMRFHALFFTEIVACLALYQRLLMQAKPSVRLLALNAFAHSCLVLTHYFAPFYSGAILIATLLVCIVRRWNPIPACLSIVIGWLAFLPWIPAFLNHAQMAKPSTWIPRPGSSALPGYYQTYLGSHFLEWALTLAVVAMIGSLAAARYGGLRRTWGPPCVSCLCFLSRSRCWVYHSSSTCIPSSRQARRFSPPGT